MSNESMDRIIGQLQAHRGEIMRRLDSIERKVDSLQAFKWKAMGMASLVAFIVSIGVELYRQGH